MKYNNLYFSSNLQSFGQKFHTSFCTLFIYLINNIIYCIELYFGLIIILYQQSK